MYKKISNKKWYINYKVHGGKVIEVLFSAKGPQLAGWCQKQLFTLNA